MFFFTFIPYFYTQYNLYCSKYERSLDTLYLKKECVSYHKPIKDYYFTDNGTYNLNGYVYDLA